MSASWHMSSKATVQAGRTGRKCRDCHNTETAVRTRYKDKPLVWAAKTKEEKKTEIVANKGTGAGKGKVRQIMVSETVQAFVCSLTAISSV